MTLSLTQLAKAGFTELSDARERVAATAALLSIDEEFFLEAVLLSPDPDRTMYWLERLSLSSPVHLKQVAQLFTKPESASRLCMVLGASKGLAEFLERHPSACEVFSREPLLPLGQEQNTQYFLDALEAKYPRAELRIRYRHQLLQTALWDLTRDDPQQHVEEITATLSDLAGAALEVALRIGTQEIEETFSADEISQVDFSIIAMGKCGARELNYLSDVDVIFVAQPQSGSEISTERALTIGTRLAQHTSKVINESDTEPGLWEVDANLRPEGKDGALVRTLESHLTYYDRWAKDWEFQALLKARPIAGSMNLGRDYVAGVSPKVWSSASRSNFVEQVQRMRERVTAHIRDEEVEYQVKLGPGGLRDIEFTVQLLQLVHGLSDETVRTQSTLESLRRLSEAGYVGREEAQSFAENYQFLRLLEHRLQLRNLSRTHLMPQEESEQRALARATREFVTAHEVVEAWQRAKLEVRELHEKLFYRPLLAAVAKLPEETHQLTSDQAQARLAAIGFADPKGALGHIAALSSGVSRRAAIQRALLPVMLQWLSEGANPDHGLLSFRILSEQLGQSHWFLRMLRDSAGAARKLTQVLSGSRYVSDLMELIPESAAWFDEEEDLLPRTLDVLASEATALVVRHEDDDAARKAIRALRRREILRLAIGSILSVTSIEQISQGLSDITTASLQGYLEIALRSESINPDFGIIALGRYGGEELGFDSDADVIYVFRGVSGCDGEIAQKRAEQIVLRIKELSEDPRLPFEIDTDLRPEGKNGSIVRTLDSYAAYYQRWSLRWESQALLRARAVAGPEELLGEMIALINTVRYPADLTEDDVREIRRIKARVEAERLPQGADPARHVKLGRGSLSDVEWTAQLLQLQYAHEHESLQTTSSLQTLRACVELKLLDSSDAQKLIDAWVFSSRVRSAITIWADKATDVLPNDFHDLEGVARLMGYQPGQASQLEEDYLTLTRKSRQVVERVFYGF